VTQSPPLLHELVERFRHNVDQYRRPDYNETQVRREFIDPFFTALGWDVDNRRGVARQYQEVIHEATVHIHGAARSPDYCFRVGPQPRFFVEAKKPAVNIRSDIGPAYQLRRYAWNAKLPLSILTDFDEFSVYDCRTRPAPNDGAATGRILCIGYEQYVERWAEIVSIFGREAVLRGDYDRYAQTTGSKRGPQGVDDAFLGEMERWRELLARNLALRNPGLSVRDLNYAVQKTIDRVLFMRIGEDRDIEPYGRLRDLLAGPGVYGRLVAAFRRADLRYNSGLFHFSAERGCAEGPDTLTPDLALDDKVLREIIGQLYYPECPYEFSLWNADILGTVYEQFLGNVIRLTAGHRAVVEQKPEVRKAGGVYYTPQYIVDYIVAHTVGELVKGQSPGQVEKLRILDPACGSGSFLLGAYQYLLDYHLQWYLEQPTKQARKEIYQGAGGQWFLTTDEKMRILLNNLYGVDIDAQAVEVTKLSLLLKVLEGDSGAQLALLPERALPDLGANIQCGNSLIGPDFYDGQMALLDDEEAYRINVFDWRAAFPEIMAAGGFDAVIGNPPYIRIQAMKQWAPLEVEYYKGRYVAASKGNYDIYVVFVEKGLSLLNPQGMLGFILPHKFMNAQCGEPLRGLIAAGQHLRQVVHFGDQQVFAGATTYTCLMFLDKGGPEEAQIEKVADLDRWRAEGVSVEGTLLAEHITKGEWNLVVGPGRGLFQRLSEMPVRLGDAADRIYQGPITSADKVYLFESYRLPPMQGLIEAFSQQLQEWVRLESSSTRMVIRSGQIQRYRAEPTVIALFPYDVSRGAARLLLPSEMERRYPLSWAYLNRSKKLLQDREKGKFRDTEWYRYGRNQNLDMWEQPKLMVPYMITRLASYLDREDAFYFINVTTGGYGIILDESLCDLAYVCGLLNSRLLGFYFTRVSTNFHGGYFAANKQYVEQLPIRTIDFSDPADVARHDQMVALVERMLQLHKDLAAAKTLPAQTMLQRQIDATDKQIDRLVYALYDLTEQEIGIVEAQTAR
jgi:hypothetical protein